MQKSKKRLTLMERIRRALRSPEQRKRDLIKSRDHRRYMNGWRRHCATRSEMRRIGSRANALKMAKFIRLGLK